MSPITHFLTGWIVANSSATIKPRDRAVVTVACVIADIDGIGIIAQALTYRSAQPLTWFDRYHHVLGHNLGFGMAVTAVAFLLSGRRWITACLAFLSFHVHLLADLAGSRGPDGYQWPIPYLLPFSDRCQLTWSGQWALNAWPNFVVTIAALILVFAFAWRRGYSPLEMFSASANRAFVNALRNRFPAPVPEGTPLS